LFLQLLGLVVVLLVAFNNGGVMSAISEGSEEGVAVVGATATTSPWKGWPMTNQNPQRTKTGPIVPDYSSFKVLDGLWLGIPSGMFVGDATIATAVSSQVSKGIIISKWGPR